MKSNLKKVILTLALACTMSLNALAGTVLIVSDQTTTGRDAPLITMLTELGHTVDTSGMGGAFNEGNNPFNNPTKLAALNNADLVIVSRVTNSGAYDGQRTQWNQLQTPLMLMSGYLTRNSRWGWTNSGSSDKTGTTMDLVAGQESHPFFNGVSSDPATIYDWSTAPNGTQPKGNYLPTAGPVAGGTTLGTYSGAPVLIDYAAGTQSLFGTMGERRVFFSQCLPHTGPR